MPHVPATDHRKRPTTPRQLQRQHRRKLKKMLRERPSQGRILTTIKPVEQMLWDRRFGEGTAQFLEVYRASAFGQAERQDCFVCLEAAAPDREICSIGVAEFVERPDAETTHSLVFGICCRCCMDRPAVIAALRRDFGDFNEISGAGGLA